MARTTNRKPCCHSKRFKVPAFVSGLPVAWPYLVIAVVIVVGNPRDPVVTAVNVLVAGPDPAVENSEISLPNTAEKADEKCKRRLWFTRAG